MNLKNENKLQNSDDDSKMDNSIRRKRKYSEIDS